MDVAFLAGGYEEDAPGVIAKNNRGTRFLGVDQSDLVDIPFGQERADLKRQCKRRESVVLETDRGNDSVDNDKHGI